MPSDSGLPRYVTDLLADPGNTLIATVTAPQDSDLYGEFAGQQVEFVVLVCYPTTADNPRPDYPLNPPQTDRVVPHMQTGAEAPLFADASVRYPVVAFSHGFLDSPINSDDYMLALSVCASYGYVVIAPFHGDPRFTNVTDRQSRRRHRRGVAPGKLHGDAGTASAFDIRGARPRSRASAMERSHR